jgi:hypothetical protein
MSEETSINIFIALWSVWGILVLFAALKDWLIGRKKTFAEKGDAMSEELKMLADVKWLKIGSTDEYAELKVWIAHICRDVTEASCIDEICINDICIGLRQKGYEIFAKSEMDHLRARIAELEAASRWVPVSERLPEVGDNCAVTSDVVMVWTDRGNMGLDYMVHAHYTYWHGYRTDRERVTHWRELPEPPSQKKDGEK